MSIFAHEFVISPSPKSRFDVSDMFLRWRQAVVNDPATAISVCHDIDREVDMCTISDPNEAYLRLLGVSISLENSVLVRSFHPREYRKGMIVRGGGEADEGISKWDSSHPLSPTLRKLSTSLSSASRYMGKVNETGSEVDELRAFADQIQDIAYGDGVKSSECFPAVSRFLVQVLDKLEEKVS